MLNALHLTKRYEDGVVALDDVSFDVGRGEIYCLLGANGAGKTTTINLFLGFLEPTSGSVRVNDVEVREAPVSARAHLAYVPENVLLYPVFTARQNLDFFARLSGRAAPSREALNEVMTQVGLPERAFDRPVRVMSKGMRQKLGLAIALVKDADALLLDEPTSGLDPKAATDFLQVLGRFRDAGKAILMSTHDVFRSKEIADRVAIMCAGRIVLEHPRHVLQHENLEQLYLTCIEGSAA